jgi:hypothetical protein
VADTLGELQHKIDDAKWSYFEAALVDELPIPEPDVGSEPVSGARTAATAKEPAQASGTRRSARRNEPEHIPGGGDCQGARPPQFLMGCELHRTC